MISPLDAQIAVASIGLDRILRGEPSWSLEKQEDAAKFRFRARQLIMRALSRREDGDDVEPPAFDYDEAKKLLEADDDELEKRHLVLYETLPDDIQDAVAAAATAAIEFLQEHLPRSLTRTVANARMSPPDPFELDRFARMWRTVVDPMHALAALAEGGLDTVMVESLKGAYPDLYALITEGMRKPPEGALLDQAIAAMRTRKGDRWDVTDDQDRQLKILLGEDPIDFDLANDYAALQPTTPAAAPKQKARSSPPVDELLPGQKQA
jgi:hypothetical protein